MAASLLGSANHSLMAILLRDAQVCVRSSNQRGVFQAPDASRSHMRAYCRLLCCIALLSERRSLSFHQELLLTFASYSTPSVVSLKKAMQTYARQGGTSSIFVHDDGLQLLDLPEREKRMAFYADHNIGWVARPPHSSEPDGFKRAGRFKKASNMNYGLQV